MYSIAVFQHNLKLLREEAGLSQAELGEELETTQGMISQWERGRSAPQLRMLDKLAEFFDVSIDELVGRCDLPIGTIDKLRRSVARYRSKHSQHSQSEAIQKFFEKIEAERKL